MSIIQQDTHSTANTPPQPAWYTANEQGYREEDWIEPGFRNQIRTYSAPGCPLWEFRSFRGELHD